MGLLSQGTVVGTYRIESVLGRGGMGVVYRALDLRLGRSVALKLLSAELDQDTDFRERFLRESRSSASIDHPNVLPVYEAAEADGNLFIAMRLVDGEDLAALLRRHGPLDPERGARLIAQVADALDAVHLHGLVHRDVKPSNVLVHSTGAREHAYLTDFGIAKKSSEHTALTATGTFVGTIDYCAPEMIRGGPLDARADVYSLGCVLFECMTGEKPFVRDSEFNLIYAHLEDPPPRPRDRRPQLPAALDAVVERAMAKEPDDRYASAGGLASAALAATGIAPAAASATTVEEHSPKPSAPRARVSRRALAAGAAVLVLVAGAAAAALLAGGDGSPGRDSQPPSGAVASTGEPAAVVAPATAGRSIVGSPLTQAPGEEGFCGGGSGDRACTVLQVTLGTVDQSVRADGVITRWTVRGGKGPLALRVVDGPRGRRRVVARGQTVQATGSGVESFAARIPVAEGQRVGVEQGRSGFLPLRARDEATIAEFFDPPLGTSPAAGDEAGYEYLYNATIEPDADRDDRGDLTQDPDHGGAGARCPRSGVVARGSGSTVIRVGAGLFGCKGGVRTPIGRLSSDVRFRLYRFAGVQLALVRVAKGRSSIRFFDLGDARATFRTARAFDDDRAADWTVTDLVLAPNGNAAWMALTRAGVDRAVVWTRSGSTVRAIDAGRLQPGSLRLGADQADVTYKDRAGRRREAGF